MALGVQTLINTGKSAPVITPSPINVVAHLIKSSRGPLNLVVPFTGLKDYEVKFGKPGSGDSNFQQTYYNVKGLYDESDPTPVLSYGLRCVPVTYLDSAVSVGDPAYYTSAGTTVAFSIGTSATTIKFLAAWQGYLSPGVAGNRIKALFTQTSPVGLTPITYDLDIYETDPVSSQLNNVEHYSGVTTSNVFQTVNQNQPSSYVYLIQSGTGTLAIEVDHYFTLAGGVDPNVEATPSEIDSILPMLNTYGINYVIAPDFMDDNTATIANNTTSQLMTKLSAYTIKRSDCHAVVAAPYGFTSSSQALKDLGIAQLKSMNFMTAYFNWFYITDLYGKERLVCPVGHILGGYWIRKANDEGQVSFSAPGGVLYPIRSIDALQYPSVTNEDADLIKSYGFNAVLFQGGYGNVLLSSRTMSTDSRFYNSHRCRSLEFLVSSFKGALLFFNQMPNNPRVRSLVTAQGEFFLSNQYDLGMFDTDAGRSQAYQFICSATNNTAAVKVQRWMVIDVATKFVEVNELIRINFNPTEIGTDINIS